MARIINAALLTALYAGFKANFRGAFAAAKPLWQRVATRVPSSTATETYAWLGAWPRIREWLGDRVLKKLKGEAYTLTNKKFETTITVPRDNIEDEQTGIFGPMFQALGQQVAEFPDELVFTALEQGWVNKCYDGQPFFDDEHPVGEGEGQVLVSNMQAGGGAAWYLLDDTRPLKPLIYQDRRPFDLTALDSPTDTNVFMKGEFVYGADGRCIAGYGFWQMAFGSKATLNSANYELARAAMASFKNDEGGTLNTKGTLLVVPPSLEGAGRRLLTAETIDGTTNEWRGTAELLVVPHLA